MHIVLTVIFPDKPGTAGCSLEIMGCGAVLWTGCPSLPHNGAKLCWKISRRLPVKQSDDDGTSYRAEI